MSVYCHCISVYCHCRASFLLCICVFPLIPCFKFVWYFNRFTSPNTPRVIIIFPRDQVQTALTSLIPSGHTLFQAHTWAVQFLTPFFRTFYQTCLPPFACAPHVGLKWPNNTSCEEMTPVGSVFTLLVSPSYRIQ